MFKLSISTQPQSFELKTINSKSKLKTTILKANTLNELCLFKIIQCRHNQPRLSRYYRDQLQHLLYVFQCELQSPKSTVIKYDIAKEYVYDLQDLFNEIVNSMQ